MLRVDGHIACVIALHILRKQDSKRGTAAFYIQDLAPNFRGLNLLSAPFAGNFDLRVRLRDRPFNTTRHEDFGPVAEHEQNVTVHQMLKRIDLLRSNRLVDGRIVKRSRLEIEVQARSGSPHALRERRCVSKPKALLMESDNLREAAR